VFDRDELTCIKLLRLYRKFRHDLPIVWVDPSLFSALPWRRFGLEKNVMVDPRGPRDPG